MKNLEFLKSKPIAHRGLFDNVNVPENSMESFRLSIENDNIIELDIHLLKDNNIIVFHDDDLKRMAGIDKKVKDMTYEEIKNIKLLNTEYTIPLFKDVLDLINGKVPIIVELKIDNKVGLLESEAVKFLDNYNGLFVIKSFNPFIVNWFKKNRPNYIRGLLVHYKKRNLKERLCHYMLFNNICKPDFLSCNYRILNKKKVKKFKKKKLVLTWGVTNQKIDKNLYDNIIYKMRI